MPGEDFYQPVEYVTIKRMEQRAIEAMIDHIGLAVTEMERAVFGLKG